MSFVGTVRDFSSDEALEALELEHYPGMTENKLHEIALEASKRWPLKAVTIIHRVGTLRMGEQIVLAMVSSAHRGDAFQATEFIVDYLKVQAPFWKKEKGAKTQRWVSQSQQDLNKSRVWLD